jgi:hypothetical protein
MNLRLNKLESYQNIIWKWLDDTEGTQASSGHSYGRQVVLIGTPRFVLNEHSHGIDKAT